MGEENREQLGLRAKQHCEMRTMPAIQ